MHEIIEIAFDTLGLLRVGCTKLGHPRAVCIFRLIPIKETLDVCIGRKSTVVALPGGAHAAPGALMSN
jgi:hypothetical protein